MRRRSASQKQNRPPRLRLFAPLGNPDSIPTETALAATRATDTSDISSTSAWEGRCRPGRRNARSTCGAGVPSDYTLRPSVRHVADITQKVRGETMTETSVVEKTTNDAATPLKLDAAVIGAGVAGLYQL